MLVSLGGIAVAPDNRGIRTARGGEWQVSNVQNVLVSAAAAGANGVL
jgi:hypothetical protein